MKRTLLVAVLIGAGIGLAPPAAWANVTATLNEFTGNDAQVQVDIAPASTPGDVLFTLTRLSPSTGEITGFWANLSGAAETQLFSAQKLSATSSAVASYQFSANAVNDLGNGVLLNGGGSPAPLDLGVRFTKVGTGVPNTVSFVLDGGMTALTPDMFANATFGARIQAIQGGEGSSKLSGSGSQVPGQSVPDSSSTVTLLGMSLCGIEWLRRKLLS